MLKTMAALLVGAVVTTGALASNALAMTVPAPVLLTSVQTDGFQKADVNVSIGVGRGYNRYRHGNRCEFRRFGCDYYHQGYYYQSPWWVVPGLVIGNNGYNHRYNGSHVQWCMDRYRSYDRRSNSWLSNSGQRRQCNSPY
jgi:BA14K-like protein